MGAMQAGIVYGYVSLVDGIVARMKETVGTKPRAIATGGLAGIVFKESNFLDEVDEFLTLNGLKTYEEQAASHVQVMSNIRGIGRGCASGAGSSAYSSSRIS